MEEAFPGLFIFIFLSEFFLLLFDNFGPQNSNFSYARFTFLQALEMKIFIKKVLQFTKIAIKDYSRSFHILKTSQRKRTLPTA